MISSLRKSIFFLLIGLCGFFAPFVVRAESPEPIIYVFSQSTCGHCRDEFEFLKQKLPDIKVVDLEIHSSEKNKELFQKISDRFSLQQGTPLTIVGKTVIAGFRDGSRILFALENSDVFLSPEEALRDPCAKVFGMPPIDPQQCEDSAGTQQTKNEENQEYCEDGSLCSEITTPDPLTGITVPFFGALRQNEYSLPILSGLLGLIDGFNPCAMWVLVIFLIALIQIGDRSKMFLVAGTFLVAEAVMYTAILTLWLGAFDFVGISNTVTLIVGLVAIGAGCFFLWEGAFTDGTCKVTNMEQKRKISQKINDIAQKPITWGVFLAILGLAFSVNVIEFACSIGIPQSFTLILSQSNIHGIQTVGYIALYILGYMLDDFLVFGIALVSIEKIGITHKFSKATNIIGGALMLLLGIILIFRPDLLQFG